MDDKNNNSKDKEKKKPVNNYLSQSIILAGLMIAMAIITTSSSFEIGGSYLVGASPNATVQVNISAPLEENGAMPVNIQDQHTPAFDIFFSQLINRTSLAVDGVENNYSITAIPGHGILVGEQLVVFDLATDRAYVGQVLSVVVDVINLDTPLNDNFSVATTIVSRTNHSLNVDGSIDKQTFVVNAPVSSDLDITRVMFQMTTVGFPELDMFGDIPGGLARGIILRVVNGRTTNLFNVKSNGELINLMYDVSFFEAAKHGVNGLGGRLTYGGQSKHGVTIRLEPGDTMQFIIQDDLTSIIDFHLIATGHIVTD